MHTYYLCCSISKSIVHTCNSPGQEFTKQWSPFVARVMIPQRKSGYELLLGCRPGLDRGPFEKTFFYKVRTQKPGKSSLSVFVHDRNRLGVVELVRQVRLLFAKVKKGVTKSWRQNSSRKRSKNAILAWFSPLFRAGSLVGPQDRCVAEFPTKTAEKEEGKNGSELFFQKWVP